MVYSKNMTVRYKGYEHPSFFTESIIASKLIRLHGLKYDLKIMLVTKIPFYNIHLDHTLPSQHITMYNDHTYNHVQHPITYHMHDLVKGKNKIEACNNQIMHHILLERGIDINGFGYHVNEISNQILHRLFQCGIDMVGRYNLKGEPIHYSMHII